MDKRTSQAWRDIDTKHHVHPFSDGKELREKGVRVISHAEGVYLWDVDGNRFLDGMAGLWCVNVGYGRRELADAAHRQMQELPYYNTFFRTTTKPAAALAEAISELTPDGLNSIFFTNSGSEANDTIVKLARFYWKLKGKPEKKLFIARDLAYHGVTVAAASLSGLEDMHLQSGLPIADFVARIEAPYPYHHSGELGADEYGLKAARALEAKILEIGADNIAAFIGEPVMGAGGVLVPPATYWPEITRICRKYDILLVADEVVCGFGRTGEWFGSDKFGIEPDLIAFAKGLSSGYLPVAGVAIHDRIASLLLEEGGEWVHGFTYSGHPVACAVALENIRILREEEVVDHVRNDTGPYLQSRLAELLDHPLVGEVRGAGLVAAVELVQDKARRLPFGPELGVARICREHAMANGLIVRAVRDCLVMAPPLIISRAQIDELVGGVRACLDLTLADLEAAGHRPF